MNINLNLYKYFYNVAYYGSYTKAAEYLMISQPSLSYSVKVLENQLNKKLFVRGTKGIELTKYGKYLYDKLEVVFNELLMIDEDDNSISGKVTLGVRSAFAYKVLPFYISEIGKIYPNLRLDFIILPHEEMLTRLENEEVDFVIDEYIDCDRFSSLKLEFYYENVFFTTKKKSSSIKSLTLNNLKDNNICLVENNQISKEFEKAHPNYKYIKVQSTPIMINYVKNDNLIGIAPLVLVNDELKKDGLVKLNTEIKLPKLSVFITCRKGEKNKNVRAIMEFFKNHIGNYEQSLNK